ncbi:NAD-dependent epimerase/dehydratase family protein [Massiliimalia massiliensis]|jgi:nucleoside-diphosphate-sugar epimerase|uniref:NAD-dependent epimerase/dehydratase family protein n=1 Tax=Massiliimalia massiliensis TaxID=1852384 RepID=UPI000985063D|nr:NAD-dependent epimerase/dehydratase family protein [Massiliimalia massiliensis]
MSRILMLGAPGNISASSIEALSAEHHAICALTHPKKDLDSYGGKVTFYFGDRDNPADLAAAREQAKADIVIDYSCFRPEQAELAVKTFCDTVKQYIFVSTVDVYGYPLSQLPMPENGSWNAPNCEYAANKVLCEEIFQKPGSQRLPLTIVRPAYSMGNKFLLTALSREGGYSLVPRLRAGKPLFSPGDGTALIHAGNAYNCGKMIARIAGDTRCIGEDFTLAHETVSTYDDYIRIVAGQLKTKPSFVHIPSDFVYCCNLPGTEDVLLNDLTRHNVYFDISKFKRFFPDFRWEKSMQESVAEFIAYNEGKYDDLSLPSYEDKLIEAYQNKA